VKYESVEKQEWNREPDTAALERAGVLADSDAEREYKMLVERGSVLSIINLAHIFEYRIPQDGGPDFASAEMWYRKAVDTGSAVATFYFGCFYFRRKNYGAAWRELNIGLERGYPPSIVRLAYLSINGIGCQRDQARARILLRQASKRGNLWAKRGLAMMDYNIGENIYVKIGGAITFIFARIQFFIEKRRYPTSERLRK